MYLKFLDAFLLGNPILFGGTRDSKLFNNCTKLIVYHQRENQNIDISN